MGNRAVELMNHVRSTLRPGVLGTLGGLRFFQLDMKNTGNLFFFRN